MLPCFLHPSISKEFRLYLSCLEYSSGHLLLHIVVLQYLLGYMVLFWFSFSLFFFYYILTTSHLFPVPTPYLPPSPDPLFLHILSKKRRSPQHWSTKHGTTLCSKIQHIPSYQSWAEATLVFFKVKSVS